MIECPDAPHRFPASSRNMAARFEVSPASGVFVTGTPLPDSGMLYTATNEQQYPQTFRITWSPSVNVRAQLHGDNTVQDGLTALWTLEAHRFDAHDLTFQLHRLLTHHATHGAQYDNLSLFIHVTLFYRLPFLFALLAP